MEKRRNYLISWGSHQLELGEKTCIMGIVNVTPDSFSDGGRFLSVADAVAHGLKMMSEGADILDIGGESTRPYSEPVTVEDELHRVIPVIEQLAPRVSIPISIDTTKAIVAKKAIEVGASIINDISALRFDPQMGETAAKLGVPIILMHMLGSPKTMQMAPDYVDVVLEVRQFFEKIIEDAENMGIEKSRLIIDPGIGFGKTVTHNLLLVQQLEVFQSLDLPILVGASRKSFIRKILQNAAGGDLEPGHPAVETGSQSILCAAVFNGAHIVRVHDVANSVLTAKLADAVLNADGASEKF